MSAVPSISVVIPTHNRRLLLERTLRTVLGQQGVDVQVVVVDDGSVDATSQFITSLHDDRISLIRNDQALGVSSARNAGLEAVDHDWVGFVDDDDLWAPNHLVSLIRAADRIGAGWACSDAVLVDSALAIIGGHRVPSEGDLGGLLLRSNLIPGGGSAVAARTELVLRAGAFDPSLALVADWDLWIRLSQASPLACVGQPHVGYLVHQGNASRSVDYMGEARDRLLVKHAGLYRSHRVTFDEQWWDSYVLGQQRAGRDRRAALTRLRLSARSGGVRTWLAAVATVVAPSVVENRHRGRLVGELENDWIDEAERWLAPLRADDR